MGRYANKTTVTVEQSKAEIERELTRYGATEFLSGWQQGRAMIAFVMKDLRVRFIVPIPEKTEKRFTHREARGYWKKVSDIVCERQWAQEVRQRWRALFLVVKAKLEAVESEISTLEHEFMAFIVLPNDMSLGDWIISRGSLKAIAGGQMPQLGEGSRIEEVE